MLRKEKGSGSADAYGSADAAKFDAVEEGARLPVGVLPQVVQAYDGTQCRHGEVWPEDAACARVHG